MQLTGGKSHCEFPRAKQGLVIYVSDKIFYLQMNLSNQHLMDGIEEWQKQALQEALFKEKSLSEEALQTLIQKTKLSRTQVCTILI